MYRNIKHTCKNTYTHINFNYASKKLHTYIHTYIEVCI